MTTFADYYELLAAVHAHVHPKVYLEIGVHQGHSLRLATTAELAVGVDPAPDLRFPMPDGARVYPTTSDQFFAGDVDGALGGQGIDLGFVDGLHFFEQSLRDFANLERWAAPEAIVLVHDCLPIDAITSSRERTTVLWSGDVWKLVVSLRTHRPDLAISTIDVAPTGLAVITGLDPSSTTVFDKFAELVSELRALTYDDILPELGQLLNVVPARWDDLVDLFAPLNTTGAGP